MNEWPELPLEAWRDTRETLHRWTQVVGKIRMSLTPPGQPLVERTALRHGARTHHLRDSVRRSLVRHGVRLRRPRPARAHQRRRRARRPPADRGAWPTCTTKVFRVLTSVKIDCNIWPVPVEIENPIPLNRDEEHCTYDREYAERFWRILAMTQAVFTRFRAEFVGKCSPVHFFWGSFDLAVTRFSGTARTGSRRRRPGHARSLLARSQQRRLLARRQPPAAARVLQLRRSRARRIPHQHRLARRRVLSPHPQRLLPPLRRAPPRRRPRRNALSTSAAPPTPPPPTTPGGIDPRWRDDWLRLYSGYEDRCFDP